MFLTIHIILLLFALGSFAHTLSGIQINNGSDTYEIRERPNNKFVIIEPKFKKPTLREITYFKIVEKPYNDHTGKEKESLEQGPDFDDSERPFTNGPGFQFLNVEPIDVQESSQDDKDNKNDSNDCNSDSDENKNNSNDRNNDSNDDSNESKNYGHESNNDSHENMNDSNDSNNDKNGSNEGKNNSNEGKSISHESKKENNVNNNESNAEKYNQSDSHNHKAISNSTEPEEKNTDHDNDIDNKDASKSLNKQGGESKNINENNIKLPPGVSKVIQERNKQFAVAKEKYVEINRKNDNSTKLLRRKRDLDYSMLPPPPVLPPLNVGMFPEFIQRMISNTPAMKDLMTPNDGSELNDQDESRPRTYGFHLNKDKGSVWNHLPFINQDNDINEPSYMINKENNEESQENNSPDSSSDGSNSGSDDDYLTPESEDEATDRSNDDNSIGGVWPEIYSPPTDFNNFKPYNPISEEKDLNNFVKVQSEDNLEQNESKKQPTIIEGPTNHINDYQKQTPYKIINEEKPKKAQKKPPLPKTKININKDLKEKIEMSFDNLGKMVPPTLTRFEENLVKTAVNDNEAPSTFGMKLFGNNGYVWNDLTNPENHYTIGNVLDKNKEWNGPSSPATDNINEYGTEPMNIRESAIEKNKHTDSPHQEDKEIDKNASDDKKNNEAVEVALDDLLKKDEFWQWLTRWTAAYIRALNEHVEELVKKEVARQVNKAMKLKNEEEKDKIDSNKDLNNINETKANVTAVEPVNTINETNKNTTATTLEKSVPENKNTSEIITSEKDKIDAMNKTISDAQKSNKTTPANAHTIYGNAVDSDHVTNIFIFYPNAENNATAKDIEAILGKKNNNVVILGNPSNNNKDSKASDSSTNSPFDDTTGIYAIDKKKDIVPDTSGPKIETPGNNSSNGTSPTDIASKGDPKPENTENKNGTETKTNTDDTSEATPSSDKDKSNVNATADAVNSNSTPVAKDSNSTTVATSPNAATGVGNSNATTPLS